MNLIVKTIDMRTVSLKNTLLICLLVLAGYGGFSQCDSEFTLGEEGGVIMSISPGEEFSFYKSDAAICADCEYLLDFGDGYSITGTGPVAIGGLVGTHTYDAFYTGEEIDIELTVYSAECTSTSLINYQYNADVACDTCNTFKPDTGRYWMSAWVKVGEQQVKTYNPDNHQTGDVIVPAELDDAYIEFFFQGPNTSVYFFPTGVVIDGWQRVVGAFDVPDGTTKFEMNLFADASEETYFDDIRIHPFNGSMKSYVYDGETFWLTSELDDNNYATFYEYDQEGGLIRIKKETARGIVTIQDTRSGTIIKE